MNKHAKPVKQIEGINDFVVKFANVNGTGSASANHLFAKAIFRMGIPVSPRNIFPSNIQGLPTWYEVRVSEKVFSSTGCRPLCWPARKSGRMQMPAPARVAFIWATRLEEEICGTILRPKTGI